MGNIEALLERATKQPQFALHDWSSPLKYANKAQNRLGSVIPILGLRLNENKFPDIFLFGFHSRK